MAYRNRLLSILPPEDLALLSPHFTAVSLDQGEVLIEEGGCFDQVLFVEGGVISFLTVMRDGTAVESVSVGREGAIGLGSSASTGVAMRRAVVQIAGEALAIDAGRMRDAFQASAAVRRMTLHYTAIMLSQVLQSAACNARHTVEARLARWLLTNCDRVEGRQLHFKHEYLAEMLGVQRTSVTLAARAMQQAGLIQYSRGVIVVTDRDGLLEVSCECYGVIRDQMNLLLPIDRA
jgi:CRP-like cAMP-binding protein